MEKFLTICYRIVVCYWLLIIGYYFFFIILLFICNAGKVDTNNPGGLNTCHKTYHGTHRR